MTMPTIPLHSAVQKSLDDTKVNYVRLGTSGLRVSVPMLGCMGFGSKEWSPNPNAQWVIEEEDSLKVLKAAYDMGIATWVTANIYSNGMSEEIIGKAIKKFQIPRQKLIIMTKCHNYVGEKPDIFSAYMVGGMVRSKDYVNRGGLSRAAIFNSVEDSLTRLNTPYIDVLQIHRFDPDTPIEETMKALHDLVQSGKVRYIGSSSMLATRFARMQFVAEKNGWTKFICMENHYNLCYREEEREMINFCNETGVGVMPWGALWGGKLSHPIGFKDSARSKVGSKHGSVTEADEQIINRVEEISNRKGWTMGQVALSWIISKGTIPVIGLNSIARVAEAGELRGKVLTEEETRYLEEPYIAKPLAPGTT